MALFKKSLLTVSSVAFRSPLLSVQSLTVCGLLRNRETMCWQCLQLKRFALSLVFSAVQPWNGISISTWPGYFRLDGWHFFFVSSSNSRLRDAHDKVRACVHMSVGLCHQDVAPPHHCTVQLSSIPVYSYLQAAKMRLWGAELSDQEQK